MHSIEVIIALLFLFLVFGTMLISINFQKENFEVFLEKKEALFSANNCATLIDAAFSNSVQSVSIENCFGEDNIVHSKNNEKTSKIISRVFKNFYLEVELNDHYQN